MVPKQQQQSKQLLIAERKEMLSIGRIAPGIKTLPPPPPFKRLCKKWERLGAQTGNIVTCTPKSPLTEDSCGIPCQSLRRSLPFRLTGALDAVVALVRLPPRPDSGPIVVIVQQRLLPQSQVTDRDSNPS